jgi:predicted outer membrane repeat protein
MKPNLLVPGLFVVILLCAAAGAGTIYVDDDAPEFGDGSSWETAYKYLQDALAEAEAAEEPVDIHVAQGRYNPDRSSAHPEGTGDRKATFRLIDEVAIRGGFAGVGAADPNTRDIVLYETALSGDLAGNDISVLDPCDLLTEPTRAENSYAVATAGPCSRSAVLEGFVVRSGNAIGPERHQLDQQGAGLLLSQYGADSCPSIRDCTFMNNSAYYGGAAYVIGAAPEFVNCTFQDNAAAEGGAIDVSAWRGPWFRSMCESMIRGCLFIGNYARGRGGALHVGAGAQWRIEGSRFAENTARVGGAIYSAVGANIANCIILHNVADEAGGAIYFDVTKLKISSCTFFGNAAQVGSGLACLAPLRGGSVPPSATVTNTVLWDDGDEIGIAEHVQMYVEYSNIQGGWPGEGNIDADPLFAKPGRWDPNGTADEREDDLWVDGDYHLRSQAGRWDRATETWVIDGVTSPCIDAGDPSSPIGHEPFPNGGRINMGTYGGAAEASKSWFGEPVCETIIAGDINGDCRVDFKDFQILASHWLQDPRAAPSENGRAEQ